MQSVLIVIHLLVVIALVAVVLLQRSEGGALGAGGGGGFMTGRGQANALSRATAILGALFFASALLMSILAGWNRAPRSILDSNAPASSKASTRQDQAARGRATCSISSSRWTQSAAAPAAPAPAARRPRPPRGARARRAKVAARRVGREEDDMSAPLSIAVYFTIWWVVLFAVLPIGRALRGRRRAWSTAARRRPRRARGAQPRPKGAVDDTGLRRSCSPRSTPTSMSRADRLALVP